MESAAKPGQQSCIIVVNKWDLARQRAATSDYEDYLTKMLPALKHTPIAFITATEAKNVQSLLDLSASIYKQTSTWIPTPRLNKAFELIKAEKTGGVKRSKAGWPKIYYATQIAINPITMLMFVNKTELFDDNYLRYITSRLQSIQPIVTQIIAGTQPQIIPIAGPTIGPVPAIEVK
ncbi:GTPase Der [subsurface metagenome]